MPRSAATHLQRVRSGLPPEPEDRPSAARRGYGRAWQKLRRLQLAREPLCRICRGAGLSVAARHVDHVVPLRAGGANKLSNLQSVCAGCHSRKTVMADRGFGRG